MINAFSFIGNKIVTTDGGCAIANNIDALAARLCHSSTKAKKPPIRAYIQ